ncbi:MAG: hypothetical protein M3R49_03720 [Chloroflexota bacterium]|nr:hypothetical protein [Chloroflexota bacterium]
MRTRSLAVLVLASLTACGSVESSSTQPSPTEPARTENPESRLSFAPLNIDDAIAYLEAFDLTCVRGVGPAGPDAPATGLQGAQCSAELPKAGARLGVFINYWPDGGVSSLSASSLPLDRDAQTEIDPVFRTRWIRYVAGISYSGANPALSQSWVLENTADTCPTTPICSLEVGDGTITHVPGIRNADQLSWLIRRR